MRNLFNGPAQGMGIQLLRYGFVGGSAFVVDFSILYILTRFFHIHYLISAGIAFVFGLLFNYIFSTLWVFNQHSMRSRWIEVVVFALIGVIGLGLNELLMYVFTDVFNNFFMLSKVFSTMIVFLWNFFARKYLLFSKSLQALQQSECKGEKI